MARRVVLHIDKHVHINDVSFEVYRSLSETVDDTSPLLMKVFEPTALKTNHVVSAERLTRDPLTPYAFFVSRHFEEEPFPEISVGSISVLPRDILLFSDQKMIEIHNGDLGLGDNLNVYMSYTYKSLDVKDDRGVHSGVEYFGPPATGLRDPTGLLLVYNPITKLIEIKYQKNTLPIVYYYKIKAKDVDGNSSKLSAIHSAEVSPNPDEVFFRIERSKDDITWTPVAYNSMTEWYDTPKAILPPENVTNLVVTPISSKEASISFDNPWVLWDKLVRKSYHYRIRIEDIAGEITRWLPFDPVDMYIKPRQVLIRRRVHNGSISSPTGPESMDVFRLTETDVSLVNAKLTMIDNQLSEAIKYGYTVFYTDELNMEATPAYAISDQTPWGNIILFKDTTMHDNILSENFMTSFELADEIFDIGLKP